MTTVAIDYADSGFAVASDGKAHWQAETAEENPASRKPPPQAQKIFKVQNRGRVFAYALTGTAYSDDLKFSLTAKAKRSADSLERATFDDPRAYIRQFSIPIKKAYEKAKKSGQFKSFSEDPSVAMAGGRFPIARMLFAGYFDREPFIGICTIPHREQIVLDAVTEVWEPLPGSAPVISGSFDIARKMFETPDPLFAQYVVPPRTDSSLEDAIARTKGCVEAQCSDQAAAIDQFCREQVGGPIQLATITRDGFRWIIPPA